jgi:hypothetical protein
MTGQGYGKDHEPGKPYRIAAAIMELPQPKGITRRELLPIC